MGKDDLRELIERQSRRLAAQDEKIAEQQRVIEGQQEEIADLRNRLKRDSRNSSRPPSSDAPWSKRRRRRKPPSDKKQGGQLGHEGRTRRLVDEDEVDDVEDHRPSECSSCGGKELEPLARRPHRHQVWEIPRVLVPVTEHRLHRARCRECGEVVAAALPEGVTKSALGPRLSALAASLSGVYRVSRREVSRLLSEVFGVTMSPGTVSAIEGRLGEGLSLPHIQALGAVRTSSVANVDETPWSERGELRWLWTAVAEGVTAHRIDSRRNAAAMKRLIGRRYRGVLVTDRMGAYDKHPLKRRQLCWAHLERDFRALAEGPRGGWVFGKKGVEIAGAVMRVHRGFRGHGDRTRLARQLRDPKRRLRRLLERGARAKHCPVRGMSKHLLARFDALFTFAEVPDVDPTNNAAERAVRKPVLWRKGCYGSQSARGERFVERVLTATATLRRRGGKSSTSSPTRSPRTSPAPTHPSSSACRSRAEDQGPRRAERVRRGRPQCDHRHSGSSARPSGRLGLRLDTHVNGYSRSTGDSR